MSDADIHPAIAVIQARMSSTRLPGKAALDMGGAPMLGRLLERLDGLPPEYGRIVATSETAADDFIANTAQDAGWQVIRGPLDDVLSRFALSLDRHPARYVVRVTGDNPFTDPAALAAMVEIAEAHGADYVHAPGLPVGAAAEVFSAACLKRCAQEATSDYDREHINGYLYDNKDKFSIIAHQDDEGCVAREVRLTVDTPEDYAFVQELYGALDGDMATPHTAVVSAAQALAQKRAQQAAQKMARKLTQELSHG